MRFEEESSELTFQQALRLLGCTRAELSALLGDGVLRRGVAPGTLDARTTLALAVERHARACDQARDRMQQHPPLADRDLQGRPVTRLGS